MDHRFASVTHPQTNEQMEVTNRTILTDLKEKLNGAKTGWADELLSILLACRTLPRVAIGETAFSLAYGTDAIVHIELKIPNTEYSIVTS